MADGAVILEWIVGRVGAVRNCTRACVLGDPAADEAEGFVLLREQHSLRLCIWRQFYSVGGLRCRKSIGSLSNCGQKAGIRVWHAGHGV